MPCSNPTSKVELSIRVGDVSSSNVSVHQGSISRPLVFSSYINELPGVCNGFDIQMYTDDKVIYVGSVSKYSGF